jgi:flavodoxin I
LKDTGIFYGSSSGKTASVATRIFEKLGSEKAVIHDVAETDMAEMQDCKNLILGIPTWGIGEMQDDWVAVQPVLEDLDLTGKTVALFGLGDQESYPDTFADALGNLHELLKGNGCSFTGTWCTLGYNFEASKAILDEDFVGLVLDEENQTELTELRVNDWLEQLDFT